jgi:NAD(P)H dehydrogenase (quinone)
MNIKPGDMISLVTGATGHVGSAVASELVAQGQTVRTLARDAGKIEPRLRAITDVRIAGYEDYDALLVAMRGATQVFLVSLPGNVRDRVPYHSNAVRAAKEAQVKHIVYLSFLEGDGTSPFSYGRENTATEEIIRRSGVVHSFIRPNFYMQIALSLALGSNGKIAAPAGTGKVGWVDRRDVAAVVTSVLLRRPQASGAYTVTGSRSLSFETVAKILSEKTGIAFRYHDEAPAAARASRIAQGIAAHQVDAALGSYELMRSGGADIVTSTVEELTGRPPRSFEALVEENSDAIR